MSRKLFVMLTALVISGEVLAAPVRLKIWLEPAQTLPAIPVTLHVEAENLSTTQSCSIPNEVALQVTPRTAPPFIANVTHRGTIGVTSFDAVSGPEITLAAGEKRDLTIWASLDSPLTRDVRLYRPDDYRLQLFIDSQLSELDYLGVQRLAAVESLVDPIVSNEVTLSVSAPAGDNARVFEWINALSDPLTWNSSLSERIWAELPESQYAPYAVPSNLNDSVREAALLEAAIAKIPDSPVADWYRLSLAQFRDNYPQVRTEEDLSRAIEMATYLRGFLTDLVARARERRLLDLARTALADVPSRERLRWMLQLNRGELTDIEPRVICVAEYPGRQSVAWLVYFNPALKAKVVPVGERNKFTPPPFDRGQPTEFLPSMPTASYLFKVTFNTPTLTWHIDATNLKIDTKTAPHKCPDDMDDHYAEYFAGEMEWPSRD